MTTVGGASVDIRPDLTGFGPRLAAGVMGPLRGVEKTAGRGLSSAFKTTGLLAGAALGGAVLAGSVRGIVSTGIAYERTMSLFRSVTQATEAQMAKAAATAQSLGSDLNLPGVSAAGATEAMTELAKAGLSTEQAIEATRGALALSIAGQTSAAQAAEITANALLMFNLPAKNATRVTDLLAGAANASTASMTDMAFALSMGGTAAAGMKVPIEDTITALTMVANAGIRGSDAGTLLKTALQRMAAPTKKSAKLMKELGLDFFDSRGQFVGMRSAVDQLQKRLGPMSVEARNAALATLFGADATRFANIAISEGATKWDKYAKQVGRAGQASELAKAQNAGLGGALDNLQSTAESVGLQFYTKVSPALKDSVKRLTEIVAATPAFVSGMGNAFGAIYDLLVKRDFTAAFRDAFHVEEDSPVVTALLFIRDRVAAIIDNLKATLEPLGDAFANLGRLLAPFAPIVIAVGAAIGAGLLYGLEAMSAILPPIVSALASFIGFLADNVNTIMAVGGAVAAFTAVLKIQRLIIAGVAAAQRLWAASIAIMRGVMLAARFAVVAFNMALAANPIGIVVAAIVALVVGLVILYKRSAKFRAIVHAVWGAIKGAIAAVANWITGTAVPAIVDAWNWIVDGVKGMWQSVKDAFTATKDAIVGIWDTVVSALTTALNFLVKWGMRILEVMTAPTRWALAIIAAVFFAIHNAIIGPLQSAWTWVMNMWTSLNAWLKTTLTSIWTFISGVFQGIWDTIVRVHTTISNAIHNAWQAVLGFIMPILTNIHVTIMRVWNGIVSAVSTALNAVWGWITSVWNRIVGFIGPIVDTIWTRVSTGWIRIFTAIRDAVTNAWNAVVKAFNDIVSAITGAVGNATDAASDVGQGIWDAITGFIGDMNQVGIDLVQGLINGIVGMGKTLWNAVRNFVKENVPEPILKILGISSPSKVTTKMGEQTAQGLINGLLSKSKDLNRTVTGMAQRMASGFNGVTMDVPIIGAQRATAAAPIRRANSTSATYVGRFAGVARDQKPLSSATDQRIIIHGDVRAADVGDFETQMFKRRRHAAIAGRALA